ncbi:MAG: hypothetical protein ABSG53_10750, partial [Thermoguttaceae bacterium]
MIKPSQILLDHLLQFVVTQSIGLRRHQGSECLECRQVFREKGGLVRLNGVWRFLGSDGRNGGE